MTKIEIEIEGCEVRIEGEDKGKVLDIVNRLHTERPAPTDTIGAILDRYTKDPNFLMDTVKNIPGMKDDKKEGIFKWFNILDLLRKLG